MTTSNGSVVLLCALISVHTPSSKDWRQPSAAELASSQDWRKGCGKGECVRLQADFDGDGKVDEAELLVGKQDSRVAVTVTLARGPRIVLTTLPEGALDYMGLALRASGTYVTACGKAYYPCDKGEPKQLKITLPAIALFKTESAESVFYWHAHTRTFRRVWLSD